MAAFQLLEIFRRTRQHAAVVLDEYGAVAGVATLDDLLEALIGEVPADEKGDPAAMMRHADGSWLIDASTPIEDVENRLDVALPDGQREGFLTLGGFVMAQLGRLPRPGDAFEWTGRRVEVIDMEGRRIGMVRISPAPRAAAGTDGESGHGHLGS
jgi:putative hemolysin